MGITSIGENRVNDAIKKFESSENMPDVEKRFIGHLQSNKTKKCVNTFDTIDSIHSLKLLKKVSKECEKIEKNIEVLLEINTSGETQKKGFYKFIKYTSGWLRPGSIARSPALLAQAVTATSEQLLQTWSDSSQSHRHWSTYFPGIKKFLITIF